MTDSPFSPDYDPERTILLFNHVPKAGGTTLFDLFQRSFGAEAFHHLKQGNPLSSIEDIDRIRVIGGHFRFGLHRQIDRPCLYIGVVREPFARIVSLYRYVRERPYHPLYPAARHSPRIFVRTLLRQRDLSVIELQCRFLTGRPSADTLTETLARHYVLAGPLDRFDEFCRVLWAKIGREMPAYERSNVSKSPMSEEDTAEFEAMKTLILKNNRGEQALIEEVGAAFETERARLAIGS